MSPIEFIPLRGVLKQNARRGGKTAFVGWTAGVVATVAGLIDSTFLLVVGVATLVSMAAWTAYDLRRRARYQRLGEATTEFDERSTG